MARAGVGGHDLAAGRRAVVFAHLAGVAVLATLLMSLAIERWLPASALVVDSFNRAVAIQPPGLPILSLPLIRGLADLAELGAVALACLAIIRSSPPRPTGSSPPVTLGGRGARLGSRGVLLAGGLCVLAVGAGRLPGHGAAPVLLLGGALVAAVLPLVSLARPEDRAWLLRIVLLALALRMSAAVALHLYSLSIGPRALVLDDESAYDFAARGLLALAADPMAQLPQDLSHLAGPYLSLLATLYGLFGPDPLVARFFGAFVGAGVVLVATGIVASLFGRGAATAAGLTLAFFPGLVVWSATVLKDSLIALLVMTSFWAALRWRPGPSWTLGVLVLSLLHLLAALRPYAALALAALLCAALLVFLLGRARRLGPLPLRVAMAASVFVGAVAFGWASAPSFLLESLRPTTLLYLQTLKRFTPAPQFTESGTPDRPLVQCPPGSIDPRCTDIARVRAVRPSATGPDLAGMIVALWELPGFEYGYRVVLSSGTITVARDQVRPLGGTAVAVRQPGSGTEVRGTVAGFWAPEGFDWGYWVVTPAGSAIAVRRDQVRSIESMDQSLAVRYLAEGMPLGLSAALLAPFSTGITGASYALLALDAAIWLALLLCALLGTARTRNGYLWLPLAFGATVLLGLALAPGNPGNLVRQRGVLLVPALAIAAGPALLQGACWLGRRWPPLRQWVASLGLTLGA